MPNPRNRVTYSSHPNRAARQAHAKGANQFRTYDTSYIQPKKKSKAPVIVCLILVVAVLAAALFFVPKLLDFGPKVDLLPAGEEATIEIIKGDTAYSVGDKLVEARLVTSTDDFVKEINKKDAASKIFPGTYIFTGGMTTEEIVNTILAGPQVVGDTLTVPEGYKRTAIADAVEKATDGRITAQQFLDASADASVYAAEYDFLADAGTNNLEGFLFPKTYTILDDADATAVVKMMLNQFKKETASLDWSYPQSMGLNIYDCVNLASIVEKEAPGDEQIRAQVAAVFYNRLFTQGAPAYGMLGSDATTAYELGEDPEAYDWSTESPYNTRKNAGLPPTPICSPGLACLKAVCSPADDYEDYFFFSFWPDANGVTQYYFDKTYDEHLATVAEHS